MTQQAARPPFDPELREALTDPRIVTSLSADAIPALREQSVVHDDEALTRGGEFAIGVHRAPGAGSSPDVEVIVWSPVRVDGPTPLLYFVHGGGLVVGTPYDDVPALLELAAATGCALASVDYRLAPEEPYPAALDDCYAALTWLADQADALNVDPARIVIAGVSAGGGLAAATALLARDRGGPALAGQLLMCPMLDDRNDSASAVQMVGHGSWDRRANATGWRAYLGDAAGRPGVPHTAAPARATDLAGLPPTFVDVGSAETFRDEDALYALRISQAGGSAELHVWPGGSHAFDFMAPAATLSRDARHARRRWLTRTLARVATPTAP